jgi:L,D-transpeptidase catalytic domain
VPGEDFELSQRLSRRGFLNLSLTGMMALALPVRLTRPEAELPAGQLGRVAEPSADLFRRPSFGAHKIMTVWRDDVLTLDGVAIGDGFPAHNNVWYMAKNSGFVHSSAIQPVRNDPNKPIYGMPYSGSLMEISVPFVDVYSEPDSTTDVAYRYYYGSTFWINGISQDDHGHTWYRIIDDKWNTRTYGRTEAFRPVPLSELTPISPQVTLEEKRIVVNLTQQWIECFEGSDLAFTTKISSGQLTDDGAYWTPQGNFITFRKRASRHMVAGNLASGYDLPGVPWVCYITENGVSFHGTYWHNDFGVPRSHGCINMTPAAAKWLYRWTRPIVPVDEQEMWVQAGTQAAIHL